MSGAGVIAFSKAQSRRGPPNDFTLAELRRSLAVVHAAIEEYRRDHEPYDRTARLRDGELARLLDAFGRYLGGREYRPPDETEPEHAA
jgi:hypothetical protein